MHETLKGAVGLSVAVAVAAVPLVVFYDDWNPKPTKIRGVSPAGKTLSEGESLVFQIQTETPERLEVTLNGRPMRATVGDPDEQGWRIVEAHQVEPQTQGWVRVVSCGGCPPDAIIPVHYLPSGEPKRRMIGVTIHQRALSGEGDDHLSARLSRAADAIAGPVLGMVPCLETGPLTLDLAWTNSGVGADAALWDQRRSQAILRAGLGLKLMASGGGVMALIDNRMTSLEVNLPDPSGDSLLCGALGALLDSSARVKRLLSEPLVREIQALVKRSLHLGELVELPDTRVAALEFQAERWGYVALVQRRESMAQPVVSTPAPPPSPYSGAAAATVDVHIDTLNDQLALHASSTQINIEGQALGDESIVRSCSAGSTPPFLAPRSRDNPELVVEGWRCALVDVEGQDAGVLWVSLRMPVVWDQLAGPVLRLDTERAQLALGCTSGDDGGAWRACPEAFDTATRDHLRRSALANVRLPMSRFLPASFRGVELVMPDPSGQWFRIQAERLDWDSLLIEVITGD